MGSTVHQTAIKHCSIRKYKSKELSQEHLQLLREAGLRTSSAGNMQSWSVIESTQKEIKEKLYKAHRKQQMILDAPMVMTFCADFNRMKKWLKLSKAKQSFDDLLGFLTGQIDACLVAQNIALCAESLGLGICYMGTTLWAMEEISNTLELPQYVIPVTSLVIGHPNESPKPKPRLAITTLFHQEKYRELSDLDIKKEFHEFENDLEKRIQSNSVLNNHRKTHQLKSAAAHYTAPYKYSKELHSKVSKDIVNFLNKQGFLESIDIKI